MNETINGGLKTQCQSLEAQIESFYDVKSVEHHSPHAHYWTHKLLKADPHKYHVTPSRLLHEVMPFVPTSERSKMQQNLAYDDVRRAARRSNIIDHLSEATMWGGLAAGAVVGYIYLNSHINLFQQHPTRIFIMANLVADGVALPALYAAWHIARHTYNPYETLWRAARKGDGIVTL